MAKAKVKAPHLQVSVVGAHLKVGAFLTNVQSSKAGGKGMSYSTCCALPLEGGSGICGTPVRAPKVCDAHPGVAMGKENTVKGLSVGDRMAYLSHEQVAALDAQGDGALEVHSFVPLDQLVVPGAGGMVWAGGMMRHLLPPKALTPPEDRVSLQAWWGLRAYLFGTEESPRFAVGRMTFRGKFQHVMLVPEEGGAVLMFPLALTRDTYEVPTVESVDLKPEVRAALAAKGAERCLSVLPTPEALDEDPHRDAREEAVLEAFRTGEVPKVGVPVAPAAVDVEVDLLALV